MLAVDAEAFSARDQHDEISRGTLEGLNEVRAGLEEMLAVVQDQQHALAAKGVGERVLDALVVAGGHGEQGRDGVGDSGGFPDWRQLAPPDPVREPVGDVSGDLQGQSRLADAADPRQRDEALLVQRPGDASGLSLPTHQGACGCREGACRPVDGSQRRERFGEIGVRDLEDPLGPVEVAEVVLT